VAALSRVAGHLPFKDGLVALLPDLRAFSRFLCRERIAARSSIPACARRGDSRRPWPRASRRQRRPCWSIVRP